MRFAGEIGEHPVGIPNNLMPYVQQVRRLLAAHGTPARQPCHAPPSQIDWISKCHVRCDRWCWGSGRSSACLVTTTTRPTAPASATTCAVGVPQRVHTRFEHLPELSLGVHIGDAPTDARMTPRVAWTDSAICCSHVVDLAEGHVAALNHIFSSREPYCDPINLGTGTGTSVLEMIKVRAPRMRRPAWI